MNAKTTTLALLAGLGVALSLGTSPPAQASPVVAVVNGGGEAVFDDPNNACVGGITLMGVGVTIQSGGSAKGFFECNFEGAPANANFGKGGRTVGGGTLSVVATSGYASPGSVTFFGPATFHFAGGESFVLDFPVSVTVTAGGPGVGTFNFCPSVCDPNSACDHETLVVGNYSIHTP
jgi:hypothetical protein